MHNLLRIIERNQTQSRMDDRRSGCGNASHAVVVFLADGLFKKPMQCLRRFIGTSGLGYSAPPWLDVSNWWNPQ